MLGTNLSCEVTVFSGQLFQGQHHSGVWDAVPCLVLVPHPDHHPTPIPSPALALGPTGPKL